MVSFTAIISTLAIAIAATKAAEPGQVRGNLNFYRTTCGVDQVQQASLFLSGNLPPNDPNAKIVGECYDLTFGIAGVGFLLNDQTETCTLTVYSNTACGSPVATYTSNVPFCKPPVAGRSWKVTCVQH